MSTYYQDANTTILHGDCIETMRTMPDNSVDSIVTDPPYGLGFMGKKWDALPPGEEWARECLRVLKPGGHLIAFGGSRTWHRLAVAIEDAGFDIRDSLAWLYGSGFPKSMNVGKAIDATVLTGKSGSRSIRKVTDSREVIGTKMGLPGKSAGQKPASHFSEAMAAEKGEDLGMRAERLGGSIAEGGHRRDLDITAPATPEAQRWEGWGTALKPAFEPIVLARKPLAEKTVARNVLAHGTGAINIDGCRIEGPPSGLKPYIRSATPEVYALGRAKEGREVTFTDHPSGRWPANVLLDEHMAGVLDEQSGSSKFFYCAKAGKSERPVVDGVAHPTVKPLAIMRWLCKLVTPTGGTILDPFAGSGTTIEAAMLEGFNVIGIERETDYLPLIQHRINRANGGKP